MDKKMQDQKIAELKEAVIDALIRSLGATEVEPGMIKEARETIKAWGSDTLPKILEGTMPSRPAPFPTGPTKKDPTKPKT